MNGIETSKANFAKMGARRFWTVVGLATFSLVVLAGMTIARYFSAMC